ncbi:MAG: class IV adenylate cyclase [Candidatus Pacebacteria bacterium]|nr:class IV adenylate cyclase [Candidatus Paceibacterota bacterium]
MKEIEIKAHLRDRKAVVEKLTSLGCTLGNPVVQKDVVFGKDISSFEAFKNDSLVLRIRETNSDIIFTLKKRLPGKFESMEYETKIDSKDNMTASLLLMGYKEAVKINKTRTKANYNDFEICLDQVEELGEFIEIEKLMPDDYTGNLDEELYDFLEALNIGREDVTFKKLDEMMFEKKLKNNL